MKDIAKRTAEVIRATAYENDTDIGFELACIGIGREQLYQFEHGKVIPSGRTLQKLALAGYDVHYILTGEKKNVEN